MKHNIIETIAVLRVHPQSDFSMMIGTVVGAFPTFSWPSVDTVLGDSHRGQWRAVLIAMSPCAPVFLPAKLTTDDRRAVNGSSGGARRRLDG